MVTTASGRVRELFGALAGGPAGPRTMTDILARKAAADPGGVPLVAPGFPGAADERITYAGLWERSRAVAAHLEDRTDVGDRVLISAMAGRDFAAGLFGAVMAGCIAVPVPPPVFPPLAERFRHIAGDCSASYVIAGEGGGLTAGDLGALFDGEGLPVVYAGAVDPVPDGWAPGHVAGPGDTAYLQYTSGTTHAPAGAVITHRALLAGLDMTARHMDLTTGTRALSWLPPWHDLGLFSVLLAVHHGAELTLMQPHDWIADPLRLVREVAARGIEVTPMPSMAWKVMADAIAERPYDVDGLDVRRWRRAWTGADVTDPWALDQFLAELRSAGVVNAPGPDLARELFGAAEFAGAVAGESEHGRHSVIRAAPGELAAGRIRPAADGIPLSCSGRVLDRGGLSVRRADGSECAAGEIGALYVTGPQACPTYWGDDSPPVRLPGDGRDWIRTGDHAALTASRVLVVVGRDADVIETGAQGTVRHYPALLEATAARAAGHLVRTHTLAAVGDDGGGVTIVAELRPKADPGAAERAITDAVAGLHKIAPRVVFARRLGTAVTTSAKLRRGEVARRLRDGELGGRRDGRAEAGR